MFCAETVASASAPWPAYLGLLEYKNKLSWKISFTIHINANDIYIQDKKKRQQDRAVVVAGLWKQAKQAKGNDRNSLYDLGLSISRIGI